MPEPVSAGITIGTALLDFFKKDGSGAVVSDITANVNSSINHLSNSIWEMLGIQSAALNNETDDLAALIELLIGDSTSDIQRMLNQSEDDILGRVNTNLYTLNDAVQTGIDIVGNVILNDIARSDRFTRSTLDSILAPLSHSNDSIFNTVEGINGKIDLGFEDINAGLGGIIGLLSQGINAHIENNITIPSEVFDLVFSKIDGVVSDVVAGHMRELDVLESIFSDVFNEQFTIQNTIAAQQAESLNELPEFIKIGNENEEFINGVWVDKTAEGMGGTLLNSAIDWLENNKGLSDEEMKNAMHEALFGDADAQQVLNDCKIRIGSFGVDGGWTKGIVGSITSFLALAIAPLNMSQVQANRMIQEFRKCFPDALLSPGDLAASFQRELINPNKAINDLRKQGFTGQDAETLLLSSYRIPEIQYLFSMWYRKELSEDGLDYALSSLGFNEAWHAPLKEIAWFIPPVQDLITMAVREVFTPEIANANGQFDDFPEEFAQHAAKQGVSREWARNYWAAHWRLPSEHMGFEMFHRRIIDENKLRGLMQALDIMPGWRDEMIALSYNPLTRVDVRRMHAMEVIDDEQTYNAYLDIGYSPENAALMLEFTKEYNSDGEILSLDVASDLTRANILDFYKDGIIEREAALALMIQAGINLAAAELFLLSADFDIDRRERKQTLDIILDKFRYGWHTYAETIDLVNRLRLETKERELALLDLEKIQVQLSKLPSKADMDKFISKRLVNENEYVDTLEKLGYAPHWANKYLALATGKGK